MTCREIVDILGKDQMVEQMVLRIAGVPKLTADLEDLCQIIYLALLEYGDERLTDLWQSGAINFLIARLIKQNLFSKNSRFYYIIKIFAARSADLKSVEFKTDDTSTIA